MKKVMERGIVFYIPDSRVGEALPDTERYKHRFKINSSSSDSVYLVSYDSAQNAGYWTCSCRGNIRHGNCKHLKSMNLISRQDILTRRVR